MSCTVFSFAGDYRVSKIEIAAQYNNIKLNVHDVSDASEVKDKSATGKVPVLTTPCGGSIFESNAILRFVGRYNMSSQLNGSCLLSQAHVDQWIDFATNEIELGGCAWVFPILGWSTFNHAATEKAKTDIKNALSVLDAHLLTRTFLVGNCVTLADIACSIGLLLPFQHVLDNGFAGKFTNVIRWLNTCYNQPEFLAVIGNVRQCTEMKSAIKGKEKKEEKPKAEKPAAAPKEEKKPKKKDDDDEEEEEEFKEEKKKVQIFPPSKMDMDEWKRQYSNNPIKEVANPWLFANVDEGYSFWRADYMYNADNNVLFMTCNLLGGFIQRMEACHKFAFGNLLIFNDTAPFEISHIWLFKGQTIPEAVLEVPDYESYVWTKLDHTDAATRKLIEEFNCWEGDFEGRKLNSTDAGKTFK